MHGLEARWPQVLLLNQGRDWRRKSGRRERRIGVSGANRTVLSSQRARLPNSECRFTYSSHPPGAPRPTLRRVQAVRAIGLTKRYEALTAVDALNIEVAPGEVRGLLGPNGAGKTTLWRMLFGLIRPDAGSVELLGHDFDGLGGEALEEVGGFVEEPSFYPYLSGAANLSLLARLDGGHTEDAIAAVLERVGLAGRGDDRVAGYSTGMNQRLG